MEKLRMNVDKVGELRFVPALNSCGASGYVEFAQYGDPLEGAEIEQMG